ncbi:nonstructural protein [Tico virus]|uniref:Nonstructural protein n=1 Tax=Tico virus TaxID=2846448 RepID=A0A482KEP2_9VIRU|nr:nonstructural protein [Tico virus]QBQ01766.1 nonstructural protein [Tico virus]
MASKYLFDRPVVSRTSDQLKRIFVHYTAFNKVCKYPITRFMSLEVPTVYYAVVEDERPSLPDFYRMGQLPARWGFPEDSQVTKRSPRKYLGLSIGLSSLDSKDYVRFDEPLLKSAISWPLTYPSHVFLNLLVKRESMGPWMFKSICATYFCRMTNCEEIDIALVRAHKIIINEATKMGLDITQFSGENLLMEICHIQCIKLLEAFSNEPSEGRVHSPIYQLLRMFSNDIVVPSLRSGSGDGDCPALVNECVTAFIDGMNGDINHPSVVSQDYE